MNLLTFVALSAAGGAGAAARLMLDGFVRSRIRGTFPLGTLLINVSGAFLLGLLTALAMDALVAESWHLIIGTGLLGGYTTFSTASFETVRLIQQRRYAAAVVNGFGMLVLALGAALLGLWAGGLL